MRVFACLLTFIATLALAQQKAPLTPEEEQKTFSLPQGYTIELVAADPDISKVVDIAFDDAGRMWAITATEYPLDANESGAAAAELFKKGGRDKVLVFDTPFQKVRQKPRVFAENLAMPMGLLPYKDGAIIGMGPEIFYLRDTDGDGRADSKQVLLSGFGIQDSHLFPHRFTRGPGDWIYFAQGAFNYSNVQTKEGTVVPFNQCKIGRFKPDGSSFEVVGAGLNNIWGFVIDRQGEMFIQEANDLGYPVVPFYVGASYPGGGNHRMKPYAPWQPHLAQFQMGGTGLSGLALCEQNNGFKAPFSNAMFVANPITRRIQAVQIHQTNNQYSLEKLDDFLTSTDEWFRPVAIYFGPCGSLYIVDWYNKIISHNEVPRNHPERDKFRSRIWRVQHKDAIQQQVPDVTKAPENELLNLLKSENSWLSRAAWRQMEDRNSVSLVPQLNLILADRQAEVGERLLALWSLEGLNSINVETLRDITTDPQRALRREAVRVLGTLHLQANSIVSILSPIIADPDPQVRAEIIRTIDKIKEHSPETVELLVRMIRPILNTPQIKLLQNGEMAHTGEGADRDFERYLIRAALERAPKQLSEFLDSAAGKSISAESRAAACLSLDGKSAALQLQALILELKRPPSNEELLLLAEYASNESVGVALSSMLNDVNFQYDLLSRLHQIRDRVKSTTYLRYVASAAQGLYNHDPKDENIALVLRLATSFRLKDLEPVVQQIIAKPGQQKQHVISAIKTLRELQSEQLEQVHKIAARAVADEALQKEAVLTLAHSKSERAINSLIELWPQITSPLRKVAVDGLTSSVAGSTALINAIKRKEIRSSEIDGYALEKLKAVLPSDSDVAALYEKLSSKMRKVLRLNGGVDDCAETEISLEGAFTVEAWVKLDPDVTNADSILGKHNGPSLNFFNGYLRVYWHNEGDLIIARRQMLPEIWTHWAVTRSSDGRFKIYMNGELDNDECRPSPTNVKGLKVGCSTTGGTAGQIAEFRVWNRERTASEIADNFALSFENDHLPDGLLHHFGMDGSWGRLNGKASVQSSLDLPPLLTAEEANEQKLKFDRIRKLAETKGDVNSGKAIFSRTCMGCHKVHGEGGEIGPNLDGTAAMGLEGLLRAILTPSAAVESGYRKFQVETKDREILEGVFVTQDDDSITIRPATGEQRNVLRTNIKRAAFTNMSMMPDGLLDTMPPQDVSNLFAFLQQTTAAPQKIEGGPELPVPSKGEPAVISIFNGRDLSGFSGEAPYWLVENQAIVGRASKGLNHNTFLCSTQKLGDFRLVLKVKLKDERGNSGIQVRSQALPHYEVRGPQADVGPGWWGKLYEENGRGLIGPVGAPEGCVKKGDWNEYEVLCVGDHIRTAINGKICTDLTDPKISKEGVICFQLHAGEPTEVMFKDLKVTANPKDELETVK